MINADADRRDPQSPVTFEGSFIDTATTTASALRVIIPSWDDGEHSIGPVSWAPRVDNAGAAVFPQSGDWALLTESAEGTWAVLLWTPA